jgi:hypothetical protein
MEALHAEVSVSVVGSFIDLRQRRGGGLLAQGHRSSPAKALFGSRSRFLGACAHGKGEGKFGGMSAHSANHRWYP